MNTHGRGPLADATYKKSSSSSDFSQEVLSPLLGPAVSDKKKDFPVVMVKYERGQYRKKEKDWCLFLYLHGRSTPKKLFFPTRLI